MADTPDYQSEIHQRLARKWAFVDTLLAGTMAMREASTGADDSMLVQFPAETDEGFAARVAMTTYDDTYGQTLSAAVGTLLRKPPRLADNVPELTRRDAEDIDLAGTHFDVFVNRLTHKALHYGAVYVIVDKPALPDGQRGEPLRLNEAERLGLRPYWTMRAGSQVQNTPRFVNVDGRVVLQQIVFREYGFEAEGQFGEREVTRYRVYALPVEQLPNRQWRRTGAVQWSLWEEQETGEGAQKKTEVVLIDSGELPPQFTTIPVAIFIANPDADDERQTCGPVLMELAELSRKDFNQRSDYERAIHRTATPVPVIINQKADEAGEGQGEQIIGDVMMECAENGDFHFAEISGNGLDAYRTALIDNKETMRQQGFETLYADASVATTATEQLLRAGKRASRMAQILHALHDCLETALIYHALWRGEAADAGGEVTMAGSGDDLVQSPEILRQMREAVANGQHALPTLWKMEQRMGILSDDFDEKAEMELLRQYKREQMELQRQIFDGGLDPNAADDPAGDAPTPEEADNTGGE